jgi:hypothetical protein
MTSSGRGAKRFAAAAGRNRRNARDQSSIERGNPGCANCADLAGVVEEAARMVGPVVEVGPRRQQRSGRDPGVVGSDADGDRPARVRADEHDTVTPVVRIRWSIAVRRSSIQPCNEKSPVLEPQPRKLNVIATYPTSYAIRSISCGNVPAERRASIGPIGKPWHRISPGASGSRVPTAGSLM